MATQHTISVTPTVTPPDTVDSVVAWIVTSAGEAVPGMGTEEDPLDLTESGGAWSRVVSLDDGEYVALFRAAISGDTVNLGADEFTVGDSGGGDDPVDVGISPVSLEEFKAHIRVSHDDEDDLLAVYLVAATEHCEAFTRTQFVTRERTDTFDDFPRACSPHGLRRWPAPLRLRRNPIDLDHDVAVVYRDAQGEEQTLGESVYRAASGSGVDASIALRPGQTWPATDGGPEAVRVTYHAGYGAASAVPRSIRMAVLQLAAHWYETREAVVVGAPTKEVEFGVKSLLWMHRAEVIS